MTDKENYVKSAYAETWIEDGIIVQSVNPAISELNLQMAKQLVADRKIASGAEERVVAVLVIPNNSINIDKDVKEYYNMSEPYVNINAIAILIDNPIILFIINIVLAFSRKKNVPTEIFNSKEKALRWLAQYK